MPTIHLPIGGSTAARTLGCPAWLGRAAKVPKGGSSSAADQGTLFHEVMEGYYRDDKEFKDQLGATAYGEYTFNTDMLNELVLPAFEAAEQVFDTYDIQELMIEPFVQYIPDVAGGSIDILGVSGDGKTVVILDWKGGHGHVRAEDNKQLIFYALSAAVDRTLGAFDIKKVEKIVGVIIQPKISHKPDVWEFTKAEVDAFEDELIEAIDSSEDERPRASSGSHCTWCPAAPYCPEKKVLARSALVLSKDNSEQLAEAMAMVDEVEAWAKAVRKAAHSALDRGGKVEGWKLVAKRASRVWADAGAVETRIRNAKKLKLTEGFEMKLKSPAKIEKLCKEKGIPFQPFADMAVMYSSGSTMAAEKDKRPAIGVKEIPDILVKMVAQS